MWCVVVPKVCVLPQFLHADRGDGGIRRVVEAQREWLPRFGFELVDDPLRADVVATHAATTVEGLPATIPLVCHTHGLYWYGYEWERWALQMNREVIRAMRRSDIVTAPSEFVARALRRAHIDPVVLHHGVDPDVWSPPPDGQVGTYVLWNKTRIDPICDARPLHELAKRAPSHSFFTTVAWPWEAVPDNMTVTGVLNYEGSKALTQHAGVYLCTTRETFGIGTIEAMACGIPVLGWDWGGQREIVTHRTNGWLAPEGDYDSLRQGLDWCLHHRVEAGRAAREAVLAHWTWERAMQRYADLYRDAARLHKGPTVSVVIPAYNMAALLHDAYDSVLRQNYSDMEIVIVDDASTDSTGALADAYAAQASDIPIKVVHNTKNLYLAEALNAGISVASGRYVVPLDADNMLGPGALRLLVDALDADRDISIAYGAMSVIEENGEEWVSTWPQQFDLRRQLKHQNQITSTALYRREVWERVGGYRRRCRTAEDADFWCRATSFGANARKVTDAVVLRYRNRSDSMSHQVPDWAWHEWYPWGRDVSLTPWIAPIPEAQREDPIIPTYETPLVSIVIPVGPGHERLVLDALDSLNAQTFRWWEAIVVNDTGAPIPWLPVWVTVVDVEGSGGRGAGAARNAGMAVAKGRLFTFLDADDYFQPRALEYMVEAYTRAGGFIYTDWFKQETGELYHAPEWDGCTSVLRQLPWPVTCLYPRAVWDATGGFDESLKAWEDWDFALRVVAAGYCGTRVAVPLFHYRVDSGTRREIGFADRESLKLDILSRWGDYITGGKEMACGCAGGGGLPSLPALDLSNGHSSGIASIVTPEGVSAHDMTLLEFIEPVASPLTFTGRVTGTRYRFGSDDDNRVRYVYKTDAESLLTGGAFRVYNGVDADTQLVAVGPPR